MNKEGCCVENAWFLNNSHKSSNGSGDEVTSEKKQKYKYFFLQED